MNNNYPPGVRPGDEDPEEIITEETQCEGCKEYFTESDCSFRGTKHGHWCENCWIYDEQILSQEYEINIVKYETFRWEHAFGAIAMMHIENFHPNPREAYRDLLDGKTLCLHDILIRRKNRAA